jgi:putative mRNA 3-end processing factor
MRIRGTRRRRSVDRGFVLSDHVDWPALVSTIQATGADRVFVTHGYREPLARWLTEHGIDARAVASGWKGEFDEADDDTEDLGPGTSDLVANGGSERVT